MQHILANKELFKGSRLIESWKEKAIGINETYDRSDYLNEQGWFTVVECTDFKKEFFEISVFEKVYQ